MRIAPSADHLGFPYTTASYGCSVLKSGQAMGDLATLRAAHRRAFLLHVDGQAARAVGRLAGALGNLLTNG